VCYKAVHFLRHQLAVWAPALAHQVAKRLADRFLGFAVERSSGFIEQQDWRIL
jgi:hypothetical protein